MFKTHNTESNIFIVVKLYIGKYVGDKDRCMDVLNKTPHFSRQNNAPLWMI